MVIAAVHDVQMERRTIVRTLRALRRRKSWSQRKLGRDLGISQAQMSRRERGALERCTIPALDRWSTALGAHLTLALRVDGERPLADARHAELQNWLVSVLRHAAWIVDAEVSFNHYGDRGRIDILAFDPVLRCLLVVEIKTRFVDAQDVLGRLDIKRRVAPKLAAERGWSASMTVPALVFREDSTTRRRIASYEALFARYALRGRTAMTWLRHPHAPAPSGVLIVVAPR